MLPWIDALRGLAILMVLANHVALVVPGLSAPVLALARFGQMGVQLFFVVSAYTLCLSWQQSRSHDGPPVLRFWLRRVFRIAPLYFFGVALFASVHVWQSSEAPPYTAGNVLANLVFVHGFVPAAQNSIVPGGWSIGVEMAFYALFPLLMAMHDRLPARWAQGGGALLGAALALLLNLAWQAHGGAPVGNNSNAYFHPVNQLPVFLIGMALFHGRARTQTLHLAPIATVSTLALVATALLWRSTHALAFALIPSSAGLAFAALALLASRLPEALWHRAGAALCRVGQLSFAIYVVHVLFAWHALQLIKPWGALHGDVAYLLALLGVTLLSCAAAALLARSIESPGIALGHRIAQTLAPRRAAARP